MVSSNHYEVEKIVGIKISKKGRIYYKIKWKNYASHHNSWVKYRDCNCDDLILQFEKHCPSYVRFRTNNITRLPKDHFLGFYTFMLNEETNYKNLIISN